MKKFRQWLSAYFDPESFNDLDIGAIGSALNDSSVRIIWLSACMDELKAINLEVDKRLLLGSEMGLLDLCSRRKAYQDILEGILTARRQVTQAVRPNQSVPVVNLDRVTV